VPEPDSPAKGEVRVAKRSLRRGAGKDRKGDVLIREAGTETEQEGGINQEFRKAGNWRVAERVVD